MRLEDLTVEVRDRDLNRVGQIRPEEMDLEAEEDFNNVGTWTLKLAVEHPLAGVLRTPGNGIIVTGPAGTLFSGPVTQPQSESTATDPKGTLAINGVTDSILLMDALAYADPTRDPDFQFPVIGTVEDKRTGPAETLMHAFVNANIGPGALGSRRTGLNGKLTMGSNGARGASTTKSGKYQKLGELLAELAAPANLGFRIIQRGTALVFETYQVADRTDLVRLDIYNSTLSGSKVIVGPPSATRVLVQGKDLVDDDDKDKDLAHLPTIKNFVVASTDAALTAESEWGRRIEVFKDDSSHETIAELTQAGAEELADKGLTTLSVQAVPMEDSSMPYGTAWNMGDKVAVVVEDQELAATVTGFVLKANSDGTKLGALIGDPTGFSRARGIVKRFAGLESRIGAIETRVAAQVSTTAVQVESMSLALYQVSNVVEEITTDSGWVALTHVTDWGAGAGSTKPISYRQIGNMVYLRGEFWRTGANSTLAANTGYTIATGLPVGARPTYNWNFGVPTTVTQPIEIEVTTGGGLIVRSRTGAAPCNQNVFWVSLAGICFTVD